MLRPFLITFLLLNTLAAANATPHVYHLAAQQESAEQIYTQANSKLQRFLKGKHSATEAIALLEEIIADYNHLQEKTKEKTWMTLMATDIRLLLGELQNKGIALYQESVTSPQQPNRLENLQLAYQYLRMANQLSGPGYMLEQIQGQIAQSLGESTLALQHYYRSLSIYQKNPPTEIDPDVAYNYFRISAIQETDQKGSLTEALQTVESGLKFLQGLQAEIQKIGNKATLERYQAVQEGLKRRQLDLFLRMPEQQTKALKAYQNAIQEYPKDYIIHLGYGNLLEQARQGDAAAAIYKQALRLNSDKHLAQLSLGRLYYSRGAELLQKANLSKNPQEITLYEKQARAFYQDAIPYLEAVLKQADNRSMVLQVLLQISAYLNDLEAYQKYKQQLQELQSGTPS